jgi:hypothetical protein
MTTVESSHSIERPALRGRDKADCERFVLTCLCGQSGREYDFLQTMITICCPRIGAGR